MKAYTIHSIRIKPGVYTEPKKIWFDVEPAPGVVSRTCQMILEEIESCKSEMGKSNLQTLINKILIKNGIPASHAIQRNTVKNNNFQKSLKMRIKYKNG